MSNSKNTHLFPSTKVTPEQFIPVENYLKKKRARFWSRHLRIDSFELPKNLKGEIFRFSNNDSAKQPVPIIQPKPQGQIFAERGLIEGKIYDSFPRVSALVFRK